MNSKQHERKNSIVLNSTGAQMKEISKGNISFVIPNEQPNQSEAIVNVEIKDIRYGQNSVNLPEITAIVNGSKIVAGVPFKEPFSYNFKRVEDEMIFKFAVTSAGDLLGFIYLEIPQKFKSMKKFKLDDWFPVKHLSSEEHGKVVKENFVARIIVDYKGIRKLESGDKEKIKPPKAQLYQEMANNLKQKIIEINNELDEFNDEGFKHLANFEKKMLKKKINHWQKGTDPKKQVKVDQGNKFIDGQKELFYRTRGAFGDTQEVKAQALTPGQFFDKSVHVTRLTKEGIQDCFRCENLTKELRFSHNELLNATQKVTNLEQGKLTVDNDVLKKDMEKLQSELTKDKKEINIKLKDASTLLEQETMKVRKYYESETTKILASQVETKSIIEDLKNKLKLLELREQNTELDHEESIERESIIIQKEEKLAADIEFLNNEKQLLEEQESEMAEMKNRMMLERQRVCEETNQLQFLKGDTELRSKQMATLEAFLYDEKDAFRRYVDKKTAEFDVLKVEIEEKKAHEENVFREFEERRSEYERKNRELIENISKLKLERARLEREKSKHEEEIKEFFKDKQLIEEEHKNTLEEITKDYEFLEEKTRILNEQKIEFEELNKKMTEFEVSLQNQNRIQQEQNSRFIIQQKQFFKRLNDTNFDLKELKNLAEEVGISVGVVDENFEEHQKLERDLTRTRQNTKKDIEVMTDKATTEKKDDDKASMIERRAGKVRDDVSVMSFAAENKIKINQDAFKLVEKIFSDSVLTIFKRQNAQKDELIQNLNDSIKNLSEKLQLMHQSIKNSKLNFFTAKNPVVASKPQVVSNPFANNSLNDSGIQNHSENKGNKIDDVDKSVDHQQDPLVDLQDSLEDLCDSSIQIVNQLSGGKSNQTSSERIEYLIEARKVFQTLFSVLKRINSKSKNADYNEDFSFSYENFDLPRLKESLQAKLKELVDFIAKIKQNNDFFNVAVDNEIVGA